MASSAPPRDWTDIRWPEVSADVRQRCWEELTSRLAGETPAAEPASEPQGDRNPYWRNEFTPRRTRVSSGGIDCGTTP